MEPLLLKPGEPFPAIPGDSQTAVRAFKRIYTAMVTFCEIHGRLPKGPELKSEIAPGIHLTDADLINPDALTRAYAASMPIVDEPHYAVSYRGRRLDGQPKPNIPPNGERDVWLVSTHYLRRAQVGAGTHWHLIYFGVMVGLFSDGKVEVTPAEKLIGIRLAPNAWRITFPDQSGIPAGATMPANEIQDAIRTQNNPARPIARR